MKRFVPWLLVAASCAYEPPLDPSAAPLLGAMAGEVVFAGDGEIGPTYVLLYDAANPGPPAGTGTPVTFAAIGADAFSGDEVGLDAAPFALTRLTPGDYLVGALVDGDANFNPLVTALAGGTCGDWLGAHLTDLVTQEQAAVQIREGEQTDDVVVVVGQQLPIERPVFELGGGVVTLDLSGAIDPSEGIPPLFRLRSTALELAQDSPPFSAEVPLVLGPTCAPPAGLDCGTVPVCACEAVQPCGTAHHVQLVDADLDGLADPHPDPALAAQGILDIWPRVYLESMAELSEFEVDGVRYPERWVAQAFPLLGEIATLAATNQLSPAEAAGLILPAGAPVPSAELSVTFVPVFLHFHIAGAIASPNGPYDVVDLRDPSVPADLLPAAPWQTTVITFTGQTWTVPNEAGLSVAGQAGVVALVP